MTWFADLAPIGTFGGSAGEVLAVGWLEADHEYRRGDMPPEVVGRLEDLYLHDWEPVSAAGWHDCSLCGRRLEDGPLMREIAGEPRMLGARNLYVPAEKVFYVAPSLVLHYVEDHDYLPPAPFLRALAALPASTEAYRAACERLW